MIDLSKIGVDLWLDESDDLWGTLPSDHTGKDPGLGRARPGITKLPSSKKYPVDIARSKELTPEAKWSFTLSTNMKTGVATSWLIGQLMADKINVKHPGTCSPTQWCSEACYARIGQQSFRGSVGVQYINTLIAEGLQDMPLADIKRWAAKTIIPTLRNYGMDNLRFNAVGDFTPGSIALFHALAEVAPDMYFWAFTRKANMLRLIKPYDNIHVNVSIDQTTPGVLGVQKGGWRTGNSFDELFDASAYLRAAGVCDFVFADNHPASEGLKWAFDSEVRPAVIFGFHGSLGTLHKTIVSYKAPDVAQYYSRVSKARVSMFYAPPFTQFQCPATMPQYHGYAWCLSCRWCMSKRKRIAKTAVEQFTQNSKRFRPLMVKGQERGARRPPGMGAMGLRAGDLVRYADGAPPAFSGTGTVVSVSTFQGEEAAVVKFANGTALSFPTHLLERAGGGRVGINYPPLAE